MQFPSVNMFGRPNDESRVVDQAAAGLVAAMGMPSGEAKTAARDVVGKCKAQLKASGLLGAIAQVDQMLAGEKTGTLPPALAVRFAWARQHKVMDQDLRFYWGLSSLERAVDEQLHQVVRMTTALSFVEQDSQAAKDGDISAAMERAAVRLRAVMPLFGEPGQPAELPEVDRYLPWELRQRVSAWNARCGTEERTAAQQQSSFNAFIRTMITAGKV